MPLIFFKPVMKSDVTIAVSFIVFITPIFGADPIPNLLWPLDNSSYTTEVVESPSTAIDPNQCLIEFGAPPAGYPNQVIKLNGSIFVDLHVNYSGIVSGKDYSFSMRVWSTTLNGLLFHYKANDKTQTFREMILYLSGGYIFMERVLSSGTETSPQSTFQMSINTWHFIGFGIDVSNGKMLIHLDGNKVEHDNGFQDNIDIVVPGVLRIGGRLNQNQPNFSGKISCAGFFANVKEPLQGYVDTSCRSPTWTTNTPDCSPTPSLERTSTRSGYFISYSGVQLSKLNQILVVQRCSRLRCAVACLRNKHCWFYKYDNSVSTCTDCLLYDSSIINWKGTGPPENYLYKWRE